MTLLEHDTEAFDESHYDRKYFEGHIARYEGRVYCQRVANVERFMGDVTGRHVLDLGCGVGFFGGTARKRGAKVVGLDFSAVALGMAKGREPGMGLVRGDATRLPFPDARFDVVLLNDIIEHLAEEPGRRMIEEVYRVLRPGGRLVFDQESVLEPAAAPRLHAYPKAADVGRNTLGVHESLHLGGRTRRNHDGDLRLLECAHCCPRCWIASQGDERPEDNGNPGRQGRGRTRKWLGKTAGNTAPESPPSPLSALSLPPRTPHPPRQSGSPRSHAVLA
jgi:SAM-dependent methyltransferase